MSGEMLSIIIIIGIAAFYFMVPFAIGAYLKYRGRMVVTCPETRRPVSVEVDVKHAALTAAIGHPDLRLRNCTRWPEKRDCGQECLLQLELSPEACAVRNILEEWYKNKSCVYCRKPFGEIRWLDHKPALLGPDKKSVEWAEIKAEELERVLATHRPVCWDCHVTESFCREYPDMIFERPEKQAVAAAKK